MTNEVKKRQRKPKSAFQKQLDVIRNVAPSHVVEVELYVCEFQYWKMERIGEQLPYFLKMQEKPSLYIKEQLPLLKHYKCHRSIRYFFLFAVIYLYQRSKVPI